MSQSLTDAAVSAYRALLEGGREGTRLEAKRVREKVDRAVWETVSAFANTEGGLLLLGIDEQEGWAVTSGFDAEKVMQRLKAGLEASAKADPKVTPIPRYELDFVDLGDAGEFIALRIHPMREDPFLIRQMPCFVSGVGMPNGSYTRIVDGDHRLNGYQISELRGLGGADVSDRQPVSGATVGDLDDEAISGVQDQIKRLHSRQLDGVTTKEEMLTRINATDNAGHVTLAGLLVLGKYPQQYYDQLFIDVVVHPGREKSTDPTGIRFLDRRVCDGRMPLAIDDAVNAVVRNLRTTSVESGTGVVSEPEIPVVVLREAIANAVIHRDYGEVGRGTQIAVDVYPDRVEVSNPGGLWGGRTVDNLDERVSESRNTALKALMMRAIDEEGRAIAESQGSGIRRMIAVLASRGMPHPEFKAQIGRFAVTIHRFGLLNPETHQWLKDYAGGVADGINRNQQIALVLAKQMGVVTAQNLRNQFGVDSDDARTDINELVDRGLLEIVSTSGPGSERYGLVLFGDHSRISERQREILQILDPVNPRTVREIAEDIGLSVGAVRNHLRDLVEAGFIEPTAPPSSRNRAYLLADPKRHAGSS